MAVLHAPGHEPGGSGREKLILLLATWFRVGHLPRMPGTWGSLAALPLWWLLQPCGPWTYGLLVSLLGVAGLYVSGRAEVILGRKDAPAIVIDEVVGQLIALAPCPVHIVPVVLGVVLFRFFDILKPFPISRINDRVEGGLGVMLDDVVAGLFAGGLILMFMKWIPL